MVRVTREKLIDLAREETERRSHTEDVISGYLIGSVARGKPLIDGTADIDLILIHQYEPARHREFIPLSENIHLDIFHHHSDLYAHPPDLRIHPWLGPSICEPIFLHDPDHFFERAQAGVRGQFYQIDNIHARSTTFLERARCFKKDMTDDHSWIANYTKSILESVNALVSLDGFPVAGRRMAVVLRDRLKDMGFEEHFITFQKLLGGDCLHATQLHDWLLAWEGAFDAAGNLSPAFLPVRKNYFRHAFRNLIDSENFESVLWNLITTWNQAIEILGNTSEAAPYEIRWMDVRTQLGIAPESRELREAELEHYLDNIEVIVENWL